MEPLSALAATMFIKPAKKIADSFFNPLVRTACDAAGIQGEKLAHALTGGYEKYLSNAYERHSYLSSIVLRNAQKRLVDYYIPLTLIRGQDHTRLKVEKFPERELEDVRRMLIVDTAGMGKTTLLKLMFLYCVDEQAGIPVFVELRKLTKKHSLLDFLVDQISGLRNRQQRDVIVKLMEQGGVTFFLDGYDEISEDEREAVTQDIQSILEKAPKNKFLMTSREEVGLTSFPSFQRYTIKPLDRDEAFALLRKYASGSEVAENLIKKLKEPSFERVGEFLRNPLLTSLLYKSFEYKNIIPLQRHIFYRQVYEALFLDHDLSKEGGGFVRQKRTGIDIDRFERVLRAFGASTYKNGKLEYSRSDISNLLESCIARVGEKKVTPSDVLHDLTHAVPLLVEDGIQLRWSHRSIQEYFAALDLCLSDPKKLEERLVSLFERRDGVHHLNLLLLCSGIDVLAFNRSIGRLLAQRLLEEYAGMYPNGVSGVSEESVDLRRRICVGRDQYLVPKTNIPGPDGEDPVQKMHKQMVKETMAKGSRRPIGGFFTLGSPFGFGELRTIESHLLDEFASNGEWPFLTKRKARQSALQGQSHIDSAIDITSGPLAFYDDCDSQINRAYVFDSLNNYLLHFSRWTFDPDAARRFIDEMSSTPPKGPTTDPWEN